MRTSTSNCIVDKIAYWMEAEGGRERQRERERERERKREVEGKRETGVRDSREGEEREGYWVYAIHISTTQLVELSCQLYSHDGRLASHFVNIRIGVLLHLLLISIQEYLRFQLPQLSASSQLL